MDRDVATYRRNCRNFTVVTADTATTRDAVHELRREYSSAMLAGFGVDTWDHYDETSTQLACIESGEVIGAIRVTGGTHTGGEVFDDFGDLRRLNPRCPGEFVTFSRYLVHPDHRGGGVGTMLAHAATSWASGETVCDDLVVTAVKRAVRGLETLGLRHLSTQRCLGPGRMPVIVMVGKVSGVLERSVRRLAARDLSILPAGERSGS